MNLWIIKYKKDKHLSFSFVTYLTRREARERFKLINDSKNWHIVKFVQEEPKKRIKPRKDGFRYFEVTSKISFRKIAYRANKDTAEFSTNNTFWEKSTTYKNIKQLLRNKTIVEIT